MEASTLLEHGDQIPLFGFNLGSTIDSLLKIKFQLEPKMGFQPGVIGEPIEVTQRTFYSQVF